MIKPTYSFYPFDAYLSVFEEYTPTAKPDEELYWEAGYGESADNAGNLIPAATY
jgi:hypothetical protein